jgi:peptide/nickel transport system permease protein
LASYIVRRLVLSLVVLWLITILSFLLIHVMPGDPARMMVGADAPQEQVDSLRHELWLDRPVIVQYGHWLGNALSGNLGTSLVYRENVVDLIAIRLPVTIYISVIALLLSMVIGIGAGMICAIRRGSALDSIISILANLGFAVPIFWLGILGIYLFSLTLGWLPVQGYTSPFDNFSRSFRQMIMPVICMAIPGIAMLARQTRSSMLEVIRQDYIRTAWSKGLSERAIVVRHAMKNSLIPVVTVLGLQLRSIVGGAVLVETVFNIPGMGRLFASSTMNKDFIVVQALTLVFGVVVLLSNLIVDISYGWLDPRIRFD